MKIPVEWITADEAQEYFGPLAKLVTLDLAASGTKRAVSWTGILPLQNC